MNRSSEYISPKLLFWEMVLYFNIVSLDIAIIHSCLHSAEQRFSIPPLNIKCSTGCQDMDLDKLDINFCDLTLACKNQVSNAGCV